MAKENDVNMDHVDSLLDKGLLKEADAKLKEMLADNPSDHEAWMVLGSIKGETGNIQDALNCLNKSIECKADYADAYFLLGHIYSATNKTSEAAKSFETAVSFAPDDVEYSCTLGEFYSQSNDINRAIKCFENVVCVQPDEFDNIFKLAVLYHQKGDFVNAVATYRKAIHIDACHEECVTALVGLLIQLNDFEEAETIISNTNEKCDISNERYILYHTLLLTEKNDFNEALDVIEESKELYKESVELRVQKALVLEKIGSFEESFDILRPVLESENVPLKAAFLFAKLSVVFDMQQDAINLLEAILDKTTPSSVDEATARNTINWLIESQIT